ncbi:MAG: iron-containing redox enzyme family protein [Burkholderiaceae bacterium]|nr:iron-containing redox enzyme family protein [Burkholderiaceae bacterium]
MKNSFIDSLQLKINEQWDSIKKGPFWNLVFMKPISKNLYYDLMIEIYHYTRHNSMNQAVTAFIDAPEGLLKFVYRHAHEELGHERMVTHDLESIQLLNRADLKRQPLPATEALIGYLYFVALKYGPIARLGYSFWAENVYHHIDDVLNKIKHDLSLTDKNLSFFVAHAKIDAKHIDEVEECIQKYVKTSEDEGLVEQVARTTLFLTGEMLKQISEKYGKNS